MEGLAIELNDQDENVKFSISVIHFDDENVWFLQFQSYLNNRVFLSRNYRLIVAPRKFDVLKTNICPRSEASRQIC